MNVKTETTHAGGFLVSELPGLMSRDSVTVAEGQNLLAGAIIAALLVAGAATAVGAPAGNGLITVGAIGPDATPGAYQLVCVAAGANAGTFNLYAPNGTLVREVAVGVAAPNDHFAITVADGAVDFALNDRWSITVAESLVTALAPAATNGTQIAAGILYGPVDATDAPRRGVRVRRDAVCKPSELVWPDGITEPQKANAIAQLTARGFVFR